METKALETSTVLGFGSRGVTMTEAARADTPTGFRIHLATFDADSLLGRHSAGVWQLVTVTSGSGWVEGEDGDLVTVRFGDAVVWEPGEQHSMGSDGGMSAIIVQSPQPLYAPGSPT
jgi:quercetin dioxygenase-like cupin family protein